MKVYERINAVQRELAKQGITKDRRNQQQGYSFRGIDDVYNALAPLLAENGLCILPTFVSRDCVEHPSKNGGTLFYVTVCGEFDFVAAEDGSKHTIRTFGEAMDSADKATNKAMSAAYKYAAFQAFAIPTEGDNDADATTPEPTKPKREKQPPAVDAAKAAAPNDIPRQMVEMAAGIGFDKVDIGDWTKSVGVDKFKELPVPEQEKFREELNEKVKVFHRLLDVIEQRDVAPGEEADKCKIVDAAHAYLAEQATRLKHTDKDGKPRPLRCTAAAINKWVTDLSETVWNEGNRSKHRGL